MTPLTESHRETVPDESISPLSQPRRLFVSATVIYPKGTVVKFVRGNRLGECWVVAFDYEGFGGLYLAEYSAKQHRLIGGIVAEASDVSDEIGVQYTNLP